MRFGRRKQEDETAPESPLESVVGETEPDAVDEPAGEIVDEESVDEESVDEESAEEESAEVVASDELHAEINEEASLVQKSAPDDRAENGPLDESEANLVRPYVDLGGLKVLPCEGLHLRVEVEEESQRVVAVGLEFGGSSLQVQPFAAPRSTGLWHEIRAQIEDQIKRQGGSVVEVDGPFGPELRADVPAVGEDGATPVLRAARFVGVDGPRWFLRGVIAGEAAEDAGKAEDIEELFRSVVVVRGSAPMPPRDLIPLHMPKSAQTTAI